MVQEKYSWRLLNFCLLVISKPMVAQVGRIGKMFIAYEDFKGHVVECF